MNFIFKNTYVLRALEFFRRKLKRTERKGYPCITCFLREEDEGIDEARIKLVNHFGGNDKGRLNSFPSGFDEATYQKAKPHFESSLKAFAEADKTLKDLFKFLIENFGIGIKPYAIRFAKDMQLGVRLSDKQDGGQNESKSSDSNGDGSNEEPRSDLVSGSKGNESTIGDSGIESEGNAGADLGNDGSVAGRESKSDPTANDGGTEQGNGTGDSNLDEVSADRGNNRSKLVGKKCPPIFAKFSIR